MDDKTKSAIVGGTIFGGLMSSAIGMVIPPKKSGAQK